MAAGSYSSKIESSEASLRFTPADIANAAHYYNRAARCLPAKFSVHGYTQEKTSSSRPQPVHPTASSQC
ncbi:hypothetical protein BPOR_0570g00050 [Botrytis porri]|uniref:Uncharacterized protein n=1 Tax=Botrytis porri TaxID=87229 RepID=A0A4Z1KE48_9HELO|nr:hypothetical protein BPOR_0570g00050 [Botrytis porri]